MNGSDSRNCRDGAEEPHPIHNRFITTGSGVVTERFGVPLHAAGGLGMSTAALARKLAWLANRGGQHNVYLSTPRLPWYYTQCLVDPLDGLWIEAVANEFIDPVDEKLSPEQEELLADIGFRKPEPDASPNHWLVLTAPVDCGEAAALLTTPLVLVYGLTELDELVVQICPHESGA